MRSPQIGNKNKLPVSYWINTSFNNSCRNTDSDAIGWQIFSDHGIRTNHASVTDVNWANKLGSSMNNNIFTQSWRTMNRSAPPHHDVGSYQAICTNYAKWINDHTKTIMAKMSTR